MQIPCFLALTMLAACDAATTSERAQFPSSTQDETLAAPERSTVSSAAEGSSEHLGQTALPRAEPPRASRADAARVRIVQSGATVDEPTEVLGVVDVHEPGRNEQAGLEIMRERAAALHADAVIGVEFHRDDKDFTDLSGLAVRYNDLLRGRTFDTLGVIRVHEGEGKDGDAMDELRRRASVLGADLIINVEWHDNDAEKDGTYLSGTAIRYRRTERSAPDQGTD